MSPYHSNHHAHQTRDQLGLPETLSQKQTEKVEHEPTVHLYI